MRYVFFLLIIVGSMNFLYGQNNTTDEKVDPYKKLEELKPFLNKLHEQLNSSEQKNNSEAFKKTEEKLKTIIIPKIDFSDTPVIDAVSSLQSFAYENDKSTEDKGVSIVFSEEFDKEFFKNPNYSTVGFNFTDIALVEALKYTTRFSGLKYQIDKKSGYVVIKKSEGDKMESYIKSYNLNESDLSKITQTSYYYKKLFNNKPTVSEKHKDNKLVQMFARYGISLKDIHVTYFNSESNTLIVMSSYQVLNKIDKVMQAFLEDK